MNRFSIVGKYPIIDNTASYMLAQGLLVEASALLSIYCVIAFERGEDAMKQYKKIWLY